jgi:hypothetical protein
VDLSALFLNVRVENAPQVANPETDITMKKEKDVRAYAGG